MYFEACVCWIPLIDKDICSHVNASINCIISQISTTLFISFCSSNGNFKGTCLCSNSAVFWTRRPGWELFGLHIRYQSTLQFRRLKDDFQVACITGDESNVFTFDRVLDSNTSQQELYNEVRSIVDGVLTGKNGAILTYGQTGSGKTHTLIGKADRFAYYCVALIGDVENEVKRGVAPRAISELVIALSKDASTCELSITISSAEIYCERIFDLLEPCNSDLQVQTLTSGSDLLTWS